MLFNAVISAAKARTYRGDCDTKGNPIRSSFRVYVDFDQNGKFSKLELPIIFSSVLAENEILKRVEPDYPSELKRAGVEGVVLLQARIDERGNVVEAHAIRGDSRLALYAVKAVLQWKYRPTYLRCEPVPIVATIAVIFRGR